VGTINWIKSIINEAEGKLVLVPWKEMLATYKRNGFFYAAS
jgi:hypothetical protein